MSDNWVVGNLQNSLDTWNSKLNEIWTLITQSPEQFKGGSIWNVIVNINGAVQAIGLALLVIFFLIGVVKTCGSFVEVKKPEQVMKLFVRFALSKAVITHGLELMLAIFNIIQGVMHTIMQTAGLGNASQTVLPQSMIDAIESCGFFESIPLWAVTLIGGLLVTILSYIMILTVYGRFFKMYLYTGLAPLMLSTFARRTNTVYRKRLFKIILCCMFRGSNNSSSVCYIFSVCKFSTCSRFFSTSC